MEALVNPYTESWKRMFSRKELSYLQFGRLLYLNQASSFWSALYNQPYEKLFNDAPYEKLKDRQEYAIKYLNQVQFLLNWLRSFAIMRAEFETNAFIHLKTLETLLAEARKNEAIVIYSKIGGAKLQELKETFTGILRGFGVTNKPKFVNHGFGIDETQFNGEAPETLGELQEKGNKAFVSLYEILTKYKELKDGFQIPDPLNAYNEAIRAGAEYMEKRQTLDKGAFVSKEAFQEALENEDIARQEFEGAKSKAERLEEEGANKRELVEETFRKLTTYVLFLRGSRLVIEAIAKNFNSSPDAWITKPDRMKELETGVAKILVELELFTTRKIEGKRQTLEEAQAEIEALEKMEGGPERLKLWQEISKAKGNPVFDYLDDFWILGGTASPEFEGPDIMNLWETRNFWRPKALKLKQALYKDFLAKKKELSRISNGYMDFINSQSDMDFISKFCGIDEM